MNPWIQLESGESILVHTVVRLKQEVFISQKGNLFTTAAPLEIENDYFNCMS